MRTSLEWMDLARCRDEDPELFFPGSVGVAAQNQAEQAALVCAQCPVQRQCGEHRNTIGASTGIWAGSYQRTKPPRKTPPINHGTDWGYHQHINQRETPCERCRFAHMHANRKWPRR